MLPFCSLLQQHSTDVSCKPSAAKRRDIQGLRAVAITLVLAFHFLPQYFPNGYLGVDMFFVLSGYLMGLVLSKNPKIDIPVTVDFYYRRLKRILPTFYLAVLISLIAMFFILSIPYIPDNRESAMAALTFRTNWEQLWRRNDYFLMEQFNELFKHSWSLSVELQFYLVVPLIFALLKNVLKEHRIHCVITLGIIALASWGYHLHLNSEPVKQFNDSFGRVWQFLLGTIAFYTSFRKPTTTPTEKENGYFVLFHLLLHIVFAIAILFAFYPGNFVMFYARSLATSLTAIYLVIGSQTILLSNSLFSYIGDISYSLYLTHWPVLILIQYYASWHEVPVVYAKLAAFVISIASAVLMYHFFEKIHLKWEKIPNLLLIGALFGTSFTIAYYAESLDTPFLGPNKHIISSNMNLIHPIYDHKDAVFQDFAGAQNALGTFPPGNETLKVLVMGNSYALQHMHIVKKVLAGRYKSLHMLAMIGNQVISNKNKPGFRRMNRLAVERLKPDVLIIATRLEPFQKEPVLPKDPLIREGIDIMRNFSLHCGHILVGSPHPHYPRHFLNHFIDRLQRNLTIDDLHMNLTSVQAETSEAWKRTQAIVKSCPKCTIVNTYQWFAHTQNNRMLMFDPVERLSYAENTVHFTHAGLKKMEGLYRNLLKPIITKNKSKTNQQRSKGISENKHV